MKTVCIYHSIDLDGWMSAAIVKYLYSLSTLDTIDFIGYNYGDPIPNIDEYDNIIMCDISFPKEEMERLHRNTIGNLIWIDHHISAIKSIDDERSLEEKALYGNIEGKRDPKFAACELTWNQFFPDKDIPEIVRLLGRYDCFGHKGTNEEQKVLEFQYGARECITNYEEAYKYLKEDISDMEDGVMLEDNTIGQILSNGKSIYQFLCTDAKQSYKNGFEILFRLEDVPKVYRFICINKERFNPINFGIDYHKEGYDGCACFHYANGIWNFSLYNDNGEVDCSLIAKTFGGGGHKGAAGFRIDNINDILLYKI